MPFICPIAVFIFDILWLSDMYGSQKPNGPKCDIFCKRVNVEWMLYKGKTNYPIQNEWNEKCWRVNIYIEWNNKKLRCTFWTFATNNFKK